MMASIADGDATGHPLIGGPFDQVMAVVSPDGRWVAYQSDESGRFEVYVRPFPDADQGRVQVSASGGEMPACSRDRRTLYFRRGDSMMAAPLVVDPSFSTGAPEVLFERRGWSRSVAGWTMTTDGRRFVLHVAATDSSAVASPGQLRVVFNWLRDLEARVPAR